MPRFIPASALLASLLLAASCTPKGDDPAAEAKPEAKPEEVPLSEQPISEAEAKAVFDNWLAAQTKLEFDAYATVYAEDFEGIKRNGHQTKHLERADWLESAKKNFDRGYKLTATGVEFEAGKGKGAEEGSMIAHFTQRWSTASFADIGPKELVIARRGDEAKIVQEEMLSSHVTRRKGRTDPPLMVLNIGDAHYAVLGLGDQEWTDETKAPALLDDFTVYRPLLSKKVSKSMREWVGREVEVSGESATPCRAKIASLEVVGRIEPTSDMDGDLAEIWDEREPTKAELANSMWPMISDDLFVFGKLDACAGDLAVPVDKATIGKLVNFTAAAEVDPKLADHVVAAFHALSDYRQEQKNYNEDFAMRVEWGDVSGKPGAWEEQEYAQSVTQLWTAGDERFVFHSASVGGGCGEWSGSLWALWRLGEGDALELVSSGPESGDFMGDSTLAPKRLSRWHDALWIRTGSELYEVRPKGKSLLIHATEPVFFGCPC